jgi:hypothetical protein
MGCKFQAAGQPDKENEQQQAWTTLSEAGLVEIRLDEFAERLRDVKRLVSGRLLELLDFGTSTKEREPVAYSLGALKGLEIKLQANAPPRDASES